MKLKATSLDYDKDNEFTDEGLIYAAFIFHYDPEALPPSYITVAIDDEAPDSIYYEAHDQIYGFDTTKLSYMVKDSVVELRFSEESEETFFWDGSKAVQIEIDMADVPAITEKLAAIWSVFLSGKNS